MMTVRQFLVIECSDVTSVLYISCTLISLNCLYCGVVCVGYVCVRGA